MVFEMTKTTLTIIDEFRDVPDKEILNDTLNRIRKIMKKDDIFICFYCGKKLKHYTPIKGKFKGEEQKYSWICDCEEGRKLVLCAG